ncbi:hypothetical protein NCC49_003025 [Naganishia albida]|nr:hypothetical protein NCC49_003025 [Naganishia albida]
MKEKHHYDEFAIAARLRSRNWIVPAYTMAPHAEGLKLLRIVCRLDFSRSRAAALVRDIEQVCAFLDTQDKETIAAWFKDHQTAKETHAKGRRGTKLNDKHSLQGKHGKTHAVC